MSWRWRTASDRSDAGTLLTGCISPKAPDSPTAQARWTRTNVLGGSSRGTVSWGTRVLSLLAYRQSRLVLPYSDYSR